MKFFFKFFLVIIFGSLLVFLLTVLSKPTPAPSLTRPVVTVINPIRGPQLGLENVHLLESLKSQWQATTDSGVNATWLWQYSAMEDQSLVDFAKSEMKDQEFGLFLETDRNSSAKSDVVYRGHGPWYFSDGLLLVSYDQGEQRKLIDAVFSKFKKTFGYYPKTVGAWWVGAENLKYMRDRYDIVASLQVADQYDLDVYSVWGTPWSIPYISSKQSALVPAPAFANSSKVVIMQWAPRDPTYGYGNTSEHSTYSMQDYSLKHYDNSYVDYLFSIFLKAPGDQVIIGLESGLPPVSYAQSYKENLIKVHNLEKQQKIAVMTAGDFAKSFLFRQQVFGGTSYFLSKGYASNDQSFWYNSENFRAGIEKQGENIFLVDLRDYGNADGEDFSFLPNSQGYLRVASPAIIDSARNPSQKILIGKTNNDLRVQKENDEVIVTDGDKRVATFTKNKLVLPEQTFVFQVQKTSIGIFLLLNGLLLCYIFFFWLQKKDKGSTLIHFGILFFCLLVAKSFLSSGDTNYLNFFFDRKELLVLPIINVFPLHSVWNILIFQSIPFVLLLVSHFIFITKKKSPLIYALCVFLFILLYSHVPNGIVTEFITKKKFAVVMLFAAYAFVALILMVGVFIKRKKYIAKLLIGLVFGFGLLASTLLFSWQKYIITSFELKSLQVIADTSKDVYMVMPKERPLYRAVVPLLFEDYRYGALLTKTNWQTVTRPEGKILTLDALDNKLIFVPRYLGSELYPEEIKKYELKKVFDNTQIQMYSH